MHSLPLAITRTTHLVWRAGRTARFDAAWLLLALEALCAPGCSDRRLTLGFDADEGGQRPDEDAGLEDDGEGRDSGEYDDDGLNAEVKGPPRGLEISLVTLSCSEECAEVHAVARGGNPPYAFSWHDDVNTSARSLCPDDDTKYTVEVTDTPDLEGEFSYPGAMALASVTAEVLDCPGKDGSMCIGNASFEGTPGINLGFAGFDLPPWKGCSGTPDIWDENQRKVPLASVAPPTASAGATYIAMYNIDNNPEWFSQELCAAVAPGTTHSLKIDLAFESNGAYGNTPAGQVQVFGGTASCGTEQLLWTSPTPAGRVWETHCFTFTSEAGFTHLSLKPHGDETAIFVDNLRSVPACD
jgi:hypothetical protein